MKEATTADHLFTPRHMVNKSINKGKNLYGAFIDLRRAFPSVIHEDYLLS